MTKRMPPMIAIQVELEDLFAAYGAAGLLAGHVAGVPDPEYVCEWAQKFGEKMARASRKRAQQPPQPNGA